MEVTTVKIHKNTKLALDVLKYEEDTYDDIIGRLISESKKEDLKEKLIEDYKSIDEEDLEILNEWESASSEV